MYCVRNRWYTPRTGRWLTPDPIGYAGGRNLYEYVGSRPWEFVDPMGLTAVGDGLRWIGWRSGGDGADELYDMFSGDAQAQDAQWEANMRKAYADCVRDVQVQARANGECEADAKCKCESLRQAINNTVGQLRQIRENEWNQIGDTTEAIAVTVTMPLVAGGGAIMNAGLGAGLGAGYRAITDTAADSDDYWDSIGWGFAVGAAYGMGVGAGNTIANRLMPNRMVAVTRWGGQAGQSGSWAMPGRPTLGNYLGSGKWQPGFSNRFAAPWNYTRADVPAHVLSGSTDQGMAAWFKAVSLNQRTIAP